jgi:LacI family transcriptional regulator
MDSVNRPNMRQLAEAAGVSHVTVSRALRNDPCISRATTKRIQALARRMGYRPNPLVSALMTQLRTTHRLSYRPVIAYLNTWWPRSAWESSATYVSQFKGARERAYGLGYDLEIFWLCEPSMNPRRMAQILRTRGIGGILVGAVQEQAIPLSFPWKDYTLATIGYSLHEPDIHRACHAHFRGMERAMGELIDRGYRRIGYVTSLDFEHRVNSLWGAAFRLHQQRLDPADRIEPLVFPGGAGTEGVAEWLKETGPDAVVNALPGVYEIVVSLGVEIPRRLAFVHLDVPESLRAQGVCGIDQLSREVGAIAAELVSTQLYTNTAGIPEHPTTQLINGAWVEGRTIGLPLGPARRRKSGVGR